MSALRLILRVLIALCAAVGGLALTGAPALAELTHVYRSKITEVPAGSGAALTGPLTGVNGMTVDGSSLWVAEHVENSNKYRTDQFNDSTGAFVSQLPEAAAGEGLAIGHSTVEEELYVAGREDVYVFDSSGAQQGTWTGADTPNGSFTESPNGVVGKIAVDESRSPSDWATGDVMVPTHSQYTGRYANLDVVDVFKPEANGKEKYVTQLNGPSPSELFNSPGEVVVSDYNGDLLVHDNAGSESLIDVFEPKGLAEYTFIGRLALPGGASSGQIPGLAVDGGNGDIYVASQDSQAGHTESTVYEFGPSLAYLGKITGASLPEETFGGTGGAYGYIQSLAVDPATHEVFVGQRLSGEEQSGREVFSEVDVFGPNVVVPDVTTGAASEVKPLSATLNGTVDPDGAGAATCQFVWGTTASFGHVAPCEEPVGEGSSPVAATIGELEPDTTYYYRLHATNGNGTNFGEASQTMMLTTSGPGMHGESVSSISSTSVTFEATVNPHDAATTYYFQYGPTTAYGSAVPPLTPEAQRGGIVGSGEGDVQITQHVQSLQAHTIYHYRVVVVSEVSPGVYEEFDGPDRSFTAQVLGGSLTLPDGRAWEQVSPVDKRGGLIFQHPGWIAASPNGSAFTYVGSVPDQGATPGGPQPAGYFAATQVLARHGSEGWSPTDLLPSYTKPGAAGDVAIKPEEYVFFSEDLSRALFERLENESVGFFPLSPLASEPTLYLHQQPLCESDPKSSECYLPLVTGKQGYADVYQPETNHFGRSLKEGEDGVDEEERGLTFEGATPDLKHVVFRSSNVAALTATPAQGGNLYEWSADEPPADRLQLISILPASEGGSAISVPSGHPYAGLGAVTGLGGETNTRGAVSSDGSRVFWNGGDHGGLYMRDVPRQETLRLDSPEPGVVPGANESPGPYFQLATSDGSKVFFLDSQRLTQDSGAHIGSGADLYECEIFEEAGHDMCHLKDLTPFGSERAAVQGVVATSSDGSYVYFVAGGLLAPGAVRGDMNLYVSHEGATKFVAALSKEGDQSDWGLSWINGDTPSDMTARVSPNGRYVTFLSVQSLTGYDNRDSETGQPDSEVYLYDADTGHLICASCNPTGARPVGAKGLVLDGGSPTGAKFELTSAATIPVWLEIEVHDSPARIRGPYQPRYLSNEGRLFFNSVGPLVPQDTNGQQDVYEYEPPGVGSCTASSSTFSEASNGCIALISSGASSQESSFMDASETGGDVFFLTSEKLVPQDLDTAVDVYDAHACGFDWGCTPPAATLPPCDTTEACHAAASAQPAIFGAPASSTFSGAGNATPAVTSLGEPPALTRSQKLAKALKMCNRVRSKRKRAVCDHRERKRYGRLSDSARKGYANRKSRG